MTDLFPESLKLHNEINSAPAHPPCRSSRFLTATLAASGLYPKITLRSREVVAGVLEAIVLVVRIPPYVLRQQVYWRYSINSAIDRYFWVSPRIIRS